MEKVCCIISYAMEIRYIAVKTAKKVLILSQKNGYSDQKKENTFDEDITSDAYYESDYDSHYDSDWSMNNPEECAEAFNLAAQVIEDMENKSMKL